MTRTEPSLHLIVATWFTTPPAAPVLLQPLVPSSKKKPTPQLIQLFPELLVVVFWTAIFPPQAVVTLFAAAAQSICPEFDITGAIHAPFSLRIIPFMQPVEFIEFPATEHVFELAL